MLDYFVALLPWDSSKMKMCCQLSLIVIVIIMIHNCVLVSTVESTCRKRIETEAEGRTSQKGEAKRSMASLFRFFSLMEIPFLQYPGCLPSGFILYPLFVLLIHTFSGTTRYDCEIGCSSLFVRSYIYLIIF